LPLNFQVKSDATSRIHL